MSKLKSFSFIFLYFLFVSFLKVIRGLTINLNELSTKYIGRKGTLVIKASKDDNFKEDTTRKTHFTTKISNGKEVDCGFWKSSEINFYVFCNIGVDIPAGNYSIDFVGIPVFNYQNYSVNIYSSYWKYDFIKLDKELIDLYSDKQTINLVKNKDFYELKFNVLSYNKEVLMMGYEPMDCRQEKDILLCQIKKNEIEKSLVENEVKVSVFYISDEPNNHGLVELPLVEKISILDNIAQKIDIFVGITRLLENVAEDKSFIAYETNVTYINKVSSNNLLEFEFENEYQEKDKSNCSFKKYDDNPLLIVCFTPKEIGKCWLKEIKSEIEVNNAHFRYNFRIQPVKNDEKIYSSKEDKGSWIMWLYPKILDFSSNDILFIDYASEGENYLKGITFNKDKGDLSCEIRQNRLLRCTVPKYHFEKDGYYFLKHTNHLDDKSFFYEIPPIKVILKGSFCFISLYYSLLLIIIMF